MSRLILYVRVDEEERISIVQLRYGTTRSGTLIKLTYHRWQGRSSAGASHKIGTSRENCTKGMAHFHHKSYGSGDSRDTHG